MFSQVRLLGFVVSLAFASISFAEQGPIWVASSVYTAGIHSKTLIVAQTSESNTFAAYSKYSGKWATHTFPKGVTAIPITGGNTIVFNLTGKGITELVAVDRLGKWRLHKLPAPTESCIPAISSNVGAIRIDDRIYGFSGLNGSWDAISSSAQPSVDDDIILAIAPNRISVFSAQTGTWAESPKLAVQEK